MHSIEEKSAVAEHHVTVEIYPDPKGSPITGQSHEDTAVRVDYSGASAKTDPAEIKLVRKLDMFIMPVVWILVFLNFFTRQSLSVARLDGFERELGISGTEFSLAISIHYIGYLLVQVPSNMLLTKVPPPIYLSVTMGVMSVGTALTAVLHNGRSLLIQRFFLGLVAAPIYPGCMYVISLFYKRKEIAARMTLVYTATIFATGMNGLLAAPLFRAMRGKLGLSGWRWLYIIFGAIAVAVSALSFFILPDEPLKTKWLTPAERQLAHDRIAEDTVELGEDGSMVQGFKDAMRDRRVWLFMVIQHVNAFAGSLRIFLPTLLATLGFGQFKTLVMTCPPYLIACVSAMCVSISSGHFNERTWHLTSLKTLAAVGFALAAATMNPSVRYFAAFVFIIGTWGGTSITQSWIASTCAQTKEKRAVAIGLGNMSASSTLIWTPYLWPESSAPRYALPLITCASGAAMSVLLFWLMQWDLRQQNKRLRQTDVASRVFYAY
ncbi:hypothetical protein J7T55_003836 [Diaporthe amygdali]|uniref:uncharacterized protein n=1 Tax=Phomopsis amygdali TaxID=1214568 RepID=UPI0022FE508A|nr:uncharacterized protein J7T55_003836 [Diaporthe amygdali]KAJ0117422.1 hypothetical protein J7T55_003836 [Diaporthe amygdali]